ncbi:CpsB/CapC family capsule biosynthesis tyrosine phosphatase [Bacillus gobiensis]|uniref:tyrosine-protein phosphatase n=1 Tax=Bacillus gobiensis TaxID=1441095 RepID=UPI003D23DA46
MIDIHCHILPGLDDGPEDIDESINMAKTAVSQGIHTIIATPHHKTVTYNNEKESILPLISSLNEELNKENIPLNIFPGQELRINGELIDEFQNDRLLGLNQSKYLLVEFPSDHVPRYAEKLLFDLQLAGLTPVIAHPERNKEIIENPDQLYKLVKNGACTQLTCASITGHFGKKIMKFSNQLIDASLAHFLASDAHNLTNRSFLFENSLKSVNDKYGNDMVYLFTENAELLFKNQLIIKEPPKKVNKKKILGLF